MGQHFVILHKDDPLAWALMPHVLARIERFCDKHQTDLDGKELARIVQYNFVQDDPLMICATAYEKGKGVFAHALACIDDITGNRFLTIMQMETDKPFGCRDDVNEVLNRLRIWGLNHMAGEARIVTRTPAQVRVFERYYGFKQHRVMMSKSLLGD